MAARRQTGHEGSRARIGTRSMSEFGRELARLMAACGLGVRELARLVPCNPGHISNLRSGRDRASAEMAARLDEVLGAGGCLLALAPAPGRRSRPGIVPGAD